MIQYDWSLLRFAYQLGMVSLIRGHLINGMKQVIAPILYWRFPEFSECLAGINEMGTQSLKVLDIGSPKLLSLFLALKRNHTVYATDIQDPEIFRRYKQHFDDWRSFRNPLGQYIVEFQDARSLEYADNTLDVVFSLEVLGHIPDEGDMIAMRELRRVLKKGGLAIIAVPYASKANELFVEHNVYERRYQGEPIFFLRQYDEHSLQNRLIKPSGLVLVKKTILRESFPFETLWHRIPKILRIPFMWAEPLVARINLKIMNPSTTPKDVTIGFKRAMNVMLVLKKEGSVLQ